MLDLIKVLEDFMESSIAILFLFKCCGILLVTYSLYLV